MRKTTDNGVIVLISDEGMKLTNGETCGKIVRLGKNDLVENWLEITQEEAERLLLALENEMEVTGDAES